MRESIKGRLFYARKLMEASGVNGAVAQVVLSILAITTVGLAHFIGFLQHVADPFVPVITQEMIAGFVSNFLLYVAFCVITARVVAMLFVLTVNSIIHLIVIMFNRRPVSRGRKIISILNAERSVMATLHLIFALIIFSFTYIDVLTVPSRYLFEFLGALLLLL